MKNGRPAGHPCHTSAAPARGIKDRTLLAIGLDVIERPRELQIPVDADEPELVHTIYRLNREGFAEFKTKKNLHSPGKNLTKIRLTKQGQKRYEELRRG